MPCFNSADHLDEAVRSVLYQSYKSWELLICDDGSKDGSVKIAEEWASRHDNIHFLQNKFEKGAAGARNTCLSKAQGRYIAFLDSDDVWLPQKLESQLRFMEENNASFVFGYCENICEKGRFISISKAPASVSLRKLIISNFIPCLTAVYDSEILGKVAQPTIEKRNDFALWLQILAQNPGVDAQCYPFVVARYRVNSYGLSANKLAGIKYFYKCLRRFAGLGPLLAMFCTFLAIGFKIFKSWSPRAYNLFVSKVM